MSLPPPSAAGAGMEITFEEDSPGNQQLPYELRENFYDKMKLTLVVVEVYLDNGHSHSGGGIGVGPDGLVLTASHLLDRPDCEVGIRCYNETVFSEADVIYNDPGRDLLLLRRRVFAIREGEAPLMDVHYVKFCPSDKITVGMEAINISHPLHLVYTFAIGHVSYPAIVEPDDDETTPCVQRNSNTRCVRDCQTSDNLELSNFLPNLQVIQLNDIHGSTGSSGSPVFNSAGLLIGMISFISGRFDYCVHVSVLEQFIREGLRDEEEKEGLKAKPEIEVSLQGSRKTKKCTSQGSKRKKRTSQGSSQGQGKKVCLGKLITEWENRKSGSLKTSADKLHTMSMPNWLKTIDGLQKEKKSSVDSQEISSSLGVATLQRTMSMPNWLKTIDGLRKGKKSIVDSQEISSLDGLGSDGESTGVLLRFEKSANTRKDQIYAEVGTVPRNMKNLVLGTGSSKTYQAYVSLQNLADSRSVLEMKILSPLEDNLNETKSDSESLNQLEFTTRSRVSCEVTPVIYKKPEVSRTVDKKLVLGSGNPATYPIVKDVADSEFSLPMYGNVEKAEICAKELDDISNLLRKKVDEAKDLLVCSLVSSNALMLLNHPMNDDKISFQFNLSRLLLSCFCLNAFRVAFSFTSKTSAPFRRSMRALCRGKSKTDCRMLCCTSFFS